MLNMNLYTVHLLLFNVSVMGPRLVHNMIYHGVGFSPLGIFLNVMLKYIQEVLVPLFSQVAKPVH